jgi:hypothetical protein
LGNRYDLAVSSVGGHCAGSLSDLGCHCDGFTVGDNANEYTLTLKLRRP